MMGRRLSNTVNVMGDLSAGLLLGGEHYIEAVPSLGLSLIFPRLLNKASLVPFVRLAAELHLAYSQNGSEPWDQAVAMSFGFKWDFR
jgi:hypothetical protein